MKWQSLMDEMKTRQLKEKNQKQCKMQTFESQCQLICMGSCCTNHHVTIQDSPAVVLSTTRTHISLVPFHQRPPGCSSHTNHTLPQGFDHTHQTSMCSCHSLSVQSMCFGSIHPFISLCRHDSSLTCVLVSVTEEPPSGSVSPQHRTASVWLLCVYLLSASWKCGCESSWAWGKCENSQQLLFSWLQASGAAVGPLGSMNETLPPTDTLSSNLQV